MAKKKPAEKPKPQRPAIMVHDLRDALRVGAIAQEQGVPITLISAPEAVATIGAAWFLNIARNLESAYPDLDVEVILDCGDAAGYAMGALRAGIKVIRFSGNPTAAKKLKEIAANYGARLASQPSEILDLREEADEDEDAALRRWIEANPK